MKCTKCQHEIDKDDFYCRFCGTQLRLTTVMKEEKKFEKVFKVELEDFYKETMQTYDQHIKELIEIRSSGNISDFCYLYKEKYDKYIADSSLKERKKYYLEAVTTILGGLLSIIYGDQNCLKMNIIELYSYDGKEADIYSNKTLFIQSAQAILYLKKELIFDKRIILKEPQLGKICGRIRECSIICGEMLSISNFDASPLD